MILTTVIISSKDKNPMMLWQGAVPHTVHFSCWRTSTFPQIPLPSQSRTRLKKNQKAWTSNCNIQTALQPCTFYRKVLSLMTGQENLEYTCVKPPKNPKHNQMILVLSFFVKKWKSYELKHLFTALSAVTTDNKEIWNLWGFVLDSEHQVHFLLLKPSQILWPISQLDIFKLFGGFFWC